MKDLRWKLTLPKNFRADHLNEIKSYCKTELKKSINLHFFIIKTKESEKQEKWKKKVARKTQNKLQALRRLKLTELIIMKWIAIEGLN